MSEDGSGSSLLQALLEIGAEVGYVQKDGRNAYHSYSYPTADAVLTKVRAACYKHGVMVAGSKSELVHADGVNRVVRITQTYCKGGHEATFQGLGEGADKSDKGTMKANTAALKYLLSAAFNISWGDDPEATDEDGKSTAKKAKTSGGRKKKAAKALSDVAPDPTELANQISETTTIDGLEELRPAVKALRETPHFDRLVSNFKEQKKRLEREEK